MVNLGPLTLWQDVGDGGGGGGGGDGKDWNKLYYERYLRETKNPKPVSYEEFLLDIDEKDYEGSFKDIMKEELGQQKTDEQATTEKTELSDLIKELSGTGEQFLEKSKTTRQQRLNELSSILRGEQENAFKENEGFILEDLSSRGLLHSSGVGESLAKEKSRLSSLTSDILRKQALSDIDAEIGQEESLQNYLTGLKSQGLGVNKELGRAGLERMFSVNDRNRQERLAREIAEENRAAMKEQALYGLFGTAAGTYAGLK